MNWFRRHITIGSRLALFALALQFVLTFGHVHAAHAQAAAHSSPSYVELVAAAIDAENGGALATLPAPDDYPSQPNHSPIEACSLCAVIAMTAHALFGWSPILHLPEAVTFVYRVTDAGFAHLDPAHVGFHSRAPPVS